MGTTSTIKILTIWSRQPQIFILIRALFSIYQRIYFETRTKVKRDHLQETVKLWMTYITTKPESMPLMKIKMMTIVTFQIHH